MPVGSDTVGSHGEEIQSPFGDFGRWDFMKPFIETITARCVAVHETYGRLTALIFFWPEHSQPISQVDYELCTRRFRDAMVLVSYMLHVDATTHRFFLSGPIPRISSYTESTSTSSDPRMVVIIKTRRGAQKAEETLGLVQRFLSRRFRVEYPGHDGYKEAKLRLRKQEDKDGSLVDFSVPVFVMLSQPKSSNPRQVESFFAAVVELAKATTSTAFSRHFSLAEIALVLTEVDVGTAERKFRELFSLGVPIKVLLPSTVPPITTTLFFRLVADSGPEYPRGEPSVAMVCSHGAAKGGLWSAVAYAHCIRQVQIKDNWELHQLDFGWMAFALKKSRSLSALSIENFQPTGDDLRIMEQIGNSNQPEQELLRSFGFAPLLQYPVLSSIPFLPFVTLEPEAILSTMTGESFTAVQVAISPNSRLPVVRLDQVSLCGKVHVIVPGLGKCSTSTAAIKNLEIQGRVEAKPRGLTALSLSCTTACASSVARFVKVFGRELLDFRARSSRQGEEAVSLADLLEACPKLKHLEVDGGSLKGLEPIFEKALHLQELSLGHTRVSNSAMIKFWRIIGDPSSRLTRTLEVFTHLTPAESAVVLQALDALVSNSRLGRVTMRMCYSLMSQYRTQVDSARQVMIRRQLLTVRQKVAFLSAIASQKASTKLDEDCASRIFTYSSRMQRRHLEVLV